MSTIETLTPEQAQVEYNVLLEQKTAYQQAGMDKKVAEWDYKIKHLEMSQKYEQITLHDIAKSFGIEGLNRALSDRRLKVEEEAKKICGDLLHVKKLSESKLYSFMDANSWRYSKDPEVSAKIMELLTPKLSGTALQLFQAMFAIKGTQASKKVAFIRIDRVRDYTQDDNPPMPELLKLVEARYDKGFDEYYIAYPVIDEEKQIDPIFFGVLRNPSKNDYHEISSWWNDITLDMIPRFNLGDMFKIAEWI